MRSIKYILLSNKNNSHVSRVTNVRLLILDKSSHLEKTQTDRKSGKPYTTRCTRWTVHDISSFQGIFRGTPPTVLSTEISIVRIFSISTAPPLNQ